MLLTASSALTVHGESDNTIDVTLFKLNLPDDWSYDPNDISDYEYTCSVSVFEGADKDNSQNDFTIKANEESSYSFRKYLQTSISIFMTMQTALLKKQPLAMWIIYEPQTIDRIYYIIVTEPSGVTYKVIISGEEN
mgnify:CR=1 FL=1